MSPKLQKAVDDFRAAVIEEYQENVQDVEFTAWADTSSVSCVPQENTRILVRNEPGTEIFHTYSSVTRPLFLKYKEWAQIPD